MLGNEVCPEERLRLLLYTGRIFICKYKGDSSTCIFSTSAK